MQSGMFTIFGTTYYTHGIGLIFVFPFAVWFLITVARCSANYSMKRKPIGLSSMVLSASISLLVFTGVFLDVFLTGQKASRLCNTMAGLHVYKKVKAEGIIGLYSIKNVSKFGLRFVEYENSIGEKYEKYMENGEEIKVKVNNFRSKIELVMERKKISNRIIVSRKKIISRTRDEIYSEFIEITTYPGWADSLFINLSGSQYSGWSCGEIETGNSNKNFTIIDVVNATIDR